MEFGAKEAAEARLLAVNEHQSIDFAMLPSRFQQQIICRIASDADNAQMELEAINPGHPAFLAFDSLPEETIASNAKIVRSTYSLHEIGS